MICDYCGIREACILAISKEPRCERPRLLLCLKCWQDKWENSAYERHSIVLPEARRVIPAKPSFSQYPYSRNPPLRA